MKEDDVVKLGVVIFKEDNYSDEDLAALQWVARALPKKWSRPVHILLIERKVDESNETTNMGVPEILEGDQLCIVFKDVRPTFDECHKKIGIKNLCGKFYYEETNTIQEILEGAIKEFELNTLVLGMAAVGSTPTRHIDLQVDSKCSIVLAKTKPLETPLRISATPADGLINAVADGPAPGPINAVADGPAPGPINA